MLLFFAHTALAGGTAWFDSTSYPVDQKVTILLHYRVGAGGMAAGDRITVRDPEFHGVRWSQWGVPILDPADCTAKRTDEDPSYGLVSAATTGSATISLSRNVPDTGGGATQSAFTYVDVVSGTLAEGDEIDVTFGDTTTNADCGQELSERAFHHVTFEVQEALGGAGDSPLADQPWFDAVADTTLTTLYVQAPSKVVAGDSFDLRVVPMDAHGNAIESWTGTVTVSADYGGGTHTFTADDHGFTLLPVTITNHTDVHRIDVTSTDGVDGRSNPIWVSAPADPPDTYVYWGDIHTHMGHDYDDEDGVNHDENVEYARDIVGLDVATESMKADPVCLGSDVLWEHLQDVCTGETVDGSFLSLLGFEWMGNLLGSDNGHHNFYFDVCTLDRPAHYDAVEYPTGIDAFDSAYGPYQYAADVAAAGTHVVIIPHAPEYTGYNWDAIAKNDEYRRTVEVYSEWGFNMAPNTDGSVPEGLAKGNHMGFIGASDNHMGWMGNPFSYKNVPSGLAAFLAPTLTRGDVFDALQGRRTYATTGVRILMDASVEDGQTFPMGSWYVADAPVVNWTVSGTDKVASVTVRTMAITDGAKVVDACVVTPGSFDATGSCTIAWDGKTETAAWIEVVQDDGEEAWSSPWWFSRDCDNDLVEDPLDRCADIHDSGDSGSGGGAGGAGGAGGGTGTDTNPETGTVDSDSPGPVDTGKTGRDCGCATSGDAGAAGVGLVAALALGRRRRR